ncbi:MAG: hypothetical protein DMF05_00625 [Verrucomicrobia bacterium]|nr:MAG: hypothetical protein DMF05_00625 [Verrucomicrobiota bacterium]
MGNLQELSAVRFSQIVDPVASSVRRSCPHSGWSFGPSNHYLNLRGFRLCHSNAIRRLVALRAWTPARTMLLQQLHGTLVAARGRRTLLRRHMAQEIVAEEALLRLTRLCGINLVTLYGVVAAVGDVRRFSHSKKLVAYFGLNPSVSQSGNFEGSGALKRHGRGALRALLIQSGKKLLQVNNPLQK